MLDSAPNFTPPPWMTAACPEPVEEFAERARQRQANLTKPPGALGQLESIAIMLAALQRTEHPSADRAAALVFAADHGLTAAGVSAFPTEVTTQMIANIAAGGAAVAVLSRLWNMPYEIVDVGSAAISAIPGAMTDKVNFGTCDARYGAAMEGTELHHAVDAGKRAVQRQSDLEVLVLGEMGIGNTAAASALAALLYNIDETEVVGPGTGLDAAGVAQKTAVVREVVETHRPAVELAKHRHWIALQRIGGLEIAALCGAMIAAAQRGIVIMVDGFIATMAAAIAIGINPTLSPWCLYAHNSAEPGHALVLQRLQAQGLVSLGMRLGEGSGAALAVPIVRAACKLHNSMATFESAAISRG